MRPVSDAVRHATIVLIWAAALAWLFWNTPGDDFKSVYLAGRLVHSHPGHVYAGDAIVFNKVSDIEWQRAADESGARRHNLHRYVYLPLWAGLASALPSSFTAANRLMMFVHLLAFGCAIVLALYHWVPQYFRWWAVLGVLILVSYWTSFADALFFNQPQFLVVAIVVAALVAADRGWARVAGMCAGVAATMKITPLIFAAYWLVTGRHRAAWWTLGPTAALCLVSLAWLGWPLHVEFLRVTQATASTGIVAWHNQSLAAVLLRSQLPVGEYGQWRMWPIPLWIRGVSVSLLGGLLWALARRRYDDRAGAAILILVWLIAMPMTWTHYYIVMIVPLASIVSIRTPGALAVASLATVLLLMPIAGPLERFIAPSLVSACIGLAYLTRRARLSIV